MIKICLDPGHGGEDRYNRGPSGYVEADGCLSIALYLGKELASTGACDVMYTRKTDMTLGIRARGEIAAKAGASLFISLHTNAGPATAGGAEAFYSVDLPGDKALAAAISSSIASTFGITNRGAKVKESTNYAGEDYYGVIDAAQDGGVHHVLLIESMFHSNSKEEAILKVDANRLKIAKCIATCVCKQFGITYPKVTTTPAAPTIMYRVILDNVQRYALSDLNKAEADVKAAVDNKTAKSGKVQRNTDNKDLFVYPAPTAPVAALNYETEVCRIYVNGTSVIALTGVTKCVNYAKATYTGHIKIQCVKDGKILQEFDVAVPNITTSVTPPAPAPKIKHPIMGQEDLKAEQMEKYLHDNNPAAPQLAQIFLDEGKIEGIRGDIAFCQSIKETGFFKFTGDVKASQNNFAGIGTVGGGVQGAAFPDARTGIRAQIQHLKAYASKEALKQACVDPRYNLVTKGIAPNWEDLNGHWAVPGIGYGESILAIYEKIKTITVEKEPTSIPEPTPIEDPVHASDDKTVEKNIILKLLQLIIDLVKKLF